MIKINSYSFNNSNQDNKLESIKLIIVITVLTTQKLDLLLQIMCQCKYQEFQAIFLTQIFQVS